MKGKIESLEEKIKCDFREHTKDGFPYCTGFILDCPYIDRKRYILLGMMQCHPCGYHKTFEEADK
jgi:hypothetical protein